MDIHILNGDELRAQFPPLLAGEIIVVRECLIDGDCSGATPDEFFSTRMEFFAQEYAVSPEEYTHKTRVEFDKIRSLPPDANVFLWFEDDLFCQLNLWFTLHFLYSCTRIENIFTVRPKADSPYNFTAMTSAELLEAYHRKRRLSREEIGVFAQLWLCVQHSSFSEMLTLAQKVQTAFPFLEYAVRAHRDRFPDVGLGKPQRVLSEIIETTGTDDFWAIFKEFTRREAVYGFGDLQIKRLLREISIGA